MVRFTKSVWENGGRNEKNFIEDIRSGDCGCCDILSDFTGYCMAVKFLVKRRL
jgi:hypothetical protein